MNQFSSSDKQEVDTQTSTQEEQQQSATTDSPQTIADAPEDSDTDFDDPNLAAAIERDIQKSREMLEQRFVALDRYINDTARIAKEIRALVQNEQS